VAPTRSLVVPLIAAAPSLHSEEDRPHVVLELGDRLVVHKPPSCWQVDDGQDEPEDAQLRLSTFVHAMAPLRQWPILDDPGFGRGFLHRLDIPSSGLVLVAKSHEALYDLRLQMASGQLERDYVVLCHGWMRPERREVRAKIHWFGLGRQAASVVSPAGRPSLTWPKVLAHASRPESGEALTLVVIRIATGRQHQIRVHTAHIGHPTVSDKKYAPDETRISDLTWCPRNFLH
ncbi:unnamed protein product, partial [Polarella glacialis]